jgi:hypothetical protein
MNKASEVIARRIERKALEVLQAADEIGGPDWREYAEMMDRLGAECLRRATVARMSHGPQAVLRTVQAWCENTPCIAHGVEHYTAEIWETGGGCTAIGVQPVGQSWHWLITDDASAPDSEHDPVALGLYSPDGDCWVCFDCRNLAHALDIIAACPAHSFGN